MRYLVRALGVVALAVVAAGCRQAPPAEPEEPARRSFEDAGSWDATAGAAAADGGGDASDPQVREAEQGWQQVREATSDAERQRQAGEMLKRTREAAEASPP
jgi:hypothetical protein